MCQTQSACIAQRKKLRGKNQGLKLIYAAPDTEAETGLLKNRLCLKTHFFDILTRELARQAALQRYQLLHTCLQTSVITQFYQQGDFKDKCLRTA